MTCLRQVSPWEAAWALRPARVSVFAAAGVAVLHSDWRSGLLGGTGAWFEGSREWQGAALAVGAWARAACASASFTSERGPRISF